MPAPSTTDEFLELVRKSGVLEEKRLGPYMEKLRAAGQVPSEPSKLAGLLVHDGLLTYFQAEQINQGKWRRFTIGKYKVLERLGAGGMGSVYLCEHKLMRRRVAVKVLPTAKADDPSSLERFYREARAVAALDHPNIVRAYDIDQDEKLHFLVMEYVDGSSLQEIIKKVGPMSVTRAAHYMRQSAVGLQNAFESAQLVHRDIKPGNILVDRTGVVKILDMGLARFFNDDEDILTKKYDENVLGTADYLAPEQAIDSHEVDIRADIYSLGATFYFCLTGKTPFTEGTIAQKLIWHQTRQPKSIRLMRPDVPEGLASLIEHMMAKQPDDRPQTPQEVADALAPWTVEPIGPPPEEEMPRLSAAATGQPPRSDVAASGSSPSAAALSGPPSSSKKKQWQVASTPGSRPSGSAPTRPPSEQATTDSPARKPLPAPLPPAFRPPPQPQAAVAEPPPVEQGEEEQVAWEKLTSDAQLAPAAHDTPSRAGRKTVPPSSPRLPAVGTASDASRRVWWVVGIVAGIFVLLASVAVLWAFLHPSGPPPSTTPKAAPAPRTFKVGKDGRFRTVQDALSQVRVGDRIVLQGPTHEEDLIVDGRDDRRKNITLESEDPSRPVVWRPRSAQPTHVLALSNVEGWKLQGIHFDGLDRCKASVLLVTGRCPGTTIERGRIQGFKTSGLLLMNCEGDESRPVTFSGLTIASAAADSAVAFGLDPMMDTVKMNRFLRLSDCRLEGAFKTPIHSPGKDVVSQVELVRVVRAATAAGPDEPVKTLGN